MKKLLNFWIFQKSSYTPYIGLWVCSKWYHLKRNKEKNRLHIFLNTLKVFLDLIWYLLMREKQNIQNFEYFFHFCTPLTVLQKHAVLGTI